MKKLSLLGLITLLLLTGCTVVPIPLNTALLPGLVPQSPPHRPTQTDIGMPVMNNSTNSINPVIPPVISPSAPTIETTANLPPPVINNNPNTNNTAPLATTQDMAAIADRIFKNETGGDVSKLLRWNSQGNFADLGIGHLVWYPANQRGSYNETFPAFLKYAQSRNVPLPNWLANRPSEGGPWKNKTAFEQAKNDKQMKELASFLEKTLGLQAAFMADQLRSNIPSMVRALPPPYQKTALDNFQVMDSTSGGLYPMLDYLVFQGSGTSTNERYNGQGWGLVQVLANMERLKPGPSALAEFMRAADDTITHRVAIAPSARRQGRLLSAWQARVRTYKVPTRIGVASR